MAEKLALRTEDNKADTVDVHVGKRLRLRRTILGISQEKLAESIGLTFQQIQKYERGVNRVSASKLFYLGQALSVPVSFFFEDLPGAEGYSLPNDNTPTAAHDGGDSQYDDPMQKAETLELVRAYYRIGDPALRQRVFDLLATLATTSGLPRKASDDE